MFLTKSTPIVRSTTETASCVTISPPRRLRWPSTWRSVLLRAALTPPRVALSAGNRPATRALATAITAAYPSSRQSGSIRMRTGIGSGSSTWLMKPASQRLIRSAAPAPRSASSRLSANSWRTIRRRPAPRASRIASSWRRADARASSRFETFAHAIRSTRPTTIDNIEKNATNGTMLRFRRRARPATGTISVLVSQEAFGFHSGG